MVLFLYELSSSILFGFYGNVRDPFQVKRKLSNFQVGRVYHLLITSYELLRKHKEDLSAAKPGLLVCDEAHRLKNW